jgi:hypothetical protein
MECLLYLFFIDGFMPSHFRPLLADIVQEEDIKELCKLLVVVSGEAAKAYAGIALAIMLVLFTFSSSVTFV